jgi:hypothetical protein
MGLVPAPIAVRPIGIAHGLGQVEPRTPRRQQPWRRAAQHAAPGPHAPGREATAILSTDAASLGERSKGLLMNSVILGEMSAFRHPVRCKENLPWVRSFASVAERVEALPEFRRRYNEQWLIGRPGDRTPARVRADLLVGSRRLEAGFPCRTPSSRCR